MTTVVSFIFTVLFSRALSLPPQVKFDHNIDALWTPSLMTCRLQVGLGLAPRFITLPIAMPIAETLGSSTSIAAMGTVLQGVIGANITLKVRFLTRSKASRVLSLLAWASLSKVTGREPVSKRHVSLVFDWPSICTGHMPQHAADASGRQILDLLQVKKPITRGCTIGATAHALGTSVAFAKEPDAGPASAVTFLLTGVTGAVLANLPFFAQAMISTAGGAF